MWIVIYWKGEVENLVNSILVLYEDERLDKPMDKEDIAQCITKPKNNKTWGSDALVE